jgi:3'(2'), 5'-bisphosphate nucleotidase
MHIARLRGGDAVWVHNRQPIDYRDLWMDERAKMLRFPGIVACSESSAVLDQLCHLAKDWNPIRYAE